jgi:hypothetical protein
MSLRKFVLMPTVLLVWTAASALAQTTTTTTGTVTRSSSFGPVGLAPTETAQINLLNTATASSSGTAASCTGTVTFTNAAGTTIGSATSFTVASDKIGAVSLPYNSSGLTARGEIMAAISLTQTSGTPCSLNTSFETFDTSTGATHVHLPGSQMGGAFGPIGHP